jgi:hypothetical protein
MHLYGKMLHSERGVLVLFGLQRMHLQSGSLRDGRMQLLASRYYRHQRVSKRVNATASRQNKGPIRLVPCKPYCLAGKSYMRLDRDTWVSFGRSEERELSHPNRVL